MWSIDTARQENACLLALLKMNGFANCDRFSYNQLTQKNETTRPGESSLSSLVADNQYLRQKVREWERYANSLAQKLHSMESGPQNYSITHTHSPPSLSEDHGFQTFLRQHQEPLWNALDFAMLPARPSIAFPTPSAAVFELLEGATTDNSTNPTGIPCVPSSNLLKDPFSPLYSTHPKRRYSSQQCIRPQKLARTLTTATDSNIVDDNAWNVFRPSVEPAVLDQSDICHGDATEPQTSWLGYVDEDF